MNTSYDSTKNEKNIAKHGISFELIHKIDWSADVTFIDERFDYGEQRYITVAPIDKRIHVLGWTKRDCVVRPISLRKANKREVRFYY